MRKGAKNCITVEILKERVGYMGDAIDHRG